MSRPEETWMFTVKTTRCRYNTLVDIVATVSVDADGNLVVWWYVVYADEASAQAAASDPNNHPSVTPAMCSQNQILSQGHARRPHGDAMFESPSRTSSALAGRATTPTRDRQLQWYVSACAAPGSTTTRSGWQPPP